jgi:hypothetical protein
MDFCWRGQMNPRELTEAGSKGGTHACFDERHCRLGFPDTGLITYSEMLDTVGGWHSSLRSSSNFTHDLCQGDALKQVESLLLLCWGTTPTLSHFLASAQ